MSLVFAGNQGTVQLPPGESGEPLEILVQPHAVVVLQFEPRHSARLHLTIGEGAGVHLVVTALPEQGNIVADVGAGARLALSLVGTAQAKHAFTSVVRLTGKGANAHVQVVVIGGGESEAEFACAVEHVSPQTFARIVVRRVQGESSFSSLKGMLKVGVAAHGTDTYLSDKALLLGEHARAISEPGLEILADDVKASHGATVGQLSADELFYMRSRGLPKALAEQLLVRAFLSSALVGVPLDVLAQLERNLSAYVTKQPTPAVPAA